MCDYESVREQLMAQVECQMSNLACVDAHELGEVIDMIKDLEEAKYYCSRNILLPHLYKAYLHLHQQQ